MTEYVELTTAQKKQYRDIKNGIVADMENILASVNPLNCTLRLRQLISMRRVRNFTQKERSAVIQVFTLASIR